VTVGKSVKSATTPNATKKGGHVFLGGGFFFSGLLEYPASTSCPPTLAIVAGFIHRAVWAIWPNSGEVGQSGQREGLGLDSGPVTTTEESEIRFCVEPWAPTGTLLTPLIDGRSFVELVTEYEEHHGWEDAGIHEGLVLGREQIQDLPRYLLHGQSLELFGDTGTVLLGCTCGNIDDGPFFGTVLVTDDEVTWRDFKNPRTDSLDWDYSDLGPFAFDKTQYEQAINDAMVEALA
jgi:hypothetical protein